MARAFDVETWIDRDPQVVWKRLTDWERAADWMAGIDALEADGPSAAGTRLAFLARGKRRESVIAGLEPGRSLVLTSRQGPVEATYTYRIEPERGGTRLRLLAECDVAGPLRLLAPLLRAAIKRADGGQPEALRRVLEAE